MNFRNLALVAALCLFTAKSDAQNIYFPSDATINYNVTRNAIIGHDGIGGNTSPTVTLNTSGFVTDSVEVYNSSLFNVTGGQINNFLTAYDTSTVTVSGGTVSRAISALNQSVATLTGSGLCASFSANGGTVNLLGGTVAFDLSSSSGKINVSGGIVSGKIIVLGNSLVTMKGGNVRGSLYAYGTSTFDLYGTNLSSVLINPNFMDSFDSFSQYHVSGTLLNGTVLTDKNLYIQNGTGARFRLNPSAVPAPASLSTLLLGAIPGAILLLKRRRR